MIVASVETPLPTRDRHWDWMTADHPTDAELQLVLRQLRMRFEKANALQADWVWRPPRREELTVERITVLLPMFQTKPHLLDKWLTQLHDAGVLATITPALTLTESAR